MFINLFKIALIIIKPIFFLNKLLGLIKKHYYFIELEVACFIYTYYCLQVMFYSLKYFIIVLINYTIIKGVCNQTSLVIIDFIHVNIRLYYTS
jgi:hypothetical protein